MANRVRSYPQKKHKYFKTMNELFDTYNKVLVVGVDNVGSAQLQAIRMALRGESAVLLGKNTMMKKCLANRLADSGSDADKIIYQRFVTERLINGNMGLVFTNGDLGKLKEKLQQYRVQAPAKAGAIAPCDVMVNAGNTGLEPTKTQFFQALNIGTKITKGTVEILKDQQVITEGTKVGSSEAALLQMLKINPFFYGLEMQRIYDNGNVYSPQVLDWTGDDVREKFAQAAARIRALGLGLSIPIAANMDSIMLNGFKKCLAISVMTSYEFEEFNGKDLKDQILNGPKPGTVAAAPAAAAPAKEEKKEESEEDDDEEMGFGLFD